MSGELGEEETEELSVRLGVLPSLRVEQRRDPLALVGVLGVCGRVSSYCEPSSSLIVSLMLVAASAAACCIAWTDGAV